MEVQLLYPRHVIFFIRELSAKMKPAPLQTTPTWNPFSRYAVGEWVVILWYGCRLAVETLQSSTINVIHNISKTVTSIAESINNFVLEWKKLTLQTYPYKKQSNCLRSWQSSAGEQDRCQLFRSVRGRKLSGHSEVLSYYHPNI